MTLFPPLGARRLLDCVGNTPMVALDRLCPPQRGVRLLAKLEGNNPAGSVKDRAAKWMIEGAEARGVLVPGVRIVEPTSGNTGIALALIAALKGYTIELVMPASATVERLRTMQAYGATVTLTPAAAGMEGAIDHARACVAAGGAVMLDQFGNPDNPRAHYESTGPEIWRDTAGAISHFVAAMGTTGTIMGTSRFLTEQGAGVQIVGVQPADGAAIPGIRRWPAAYLPRIFEPERVHHIVDVSQDQAETMARRLAREEGIFCGVSGAGAVAAALQVASGLTQGLIVVLIPDRGDRYLSASVFAGTPPQEAHR